MNRFTPTTTGFSLFLLDKRVSRIGDRDSPHDIVPCWRTPQPAPHAHEDHEINIVVRGNARYIWGSGEITLVTVGQAFAIPAGILHTVEVDDYLLLRGLWIHPDRFRALTYPDAPVSLPQRVSDRGLLATANEIFEQSQAEYARQDGWQEDSLRSLGRLAAICFLRMMQSPASRTVAHPTIERVLSVRAWMDRHYLEEITLAELAERACLSVSQFSELFRRRFGVSPKAYLIRQRLHRAMVLLATTDLTVLEIAQTTGVSHLSNFHTLFKAYTGLSPQEYRKKCQTETKIPHDSFADPALQ